MSEKRFYAGNLPFDATTEDAAAGGETNNKDKR